MAQQYGLYIVGCFSQCDLVRRAFLQCVDCSLFFPGVVDRARHTGPPPFSDRSIVNLTINCNLFICDRSSKGPIWSSLCLLFPPLAARPERKVRPTLSAPSLTNLLVVQQRTGVRHTIQKDFYQINPSEERSR